MREAVDCVRQNGGSDRLAEEIKHVWPRETLDVQQLSNLLEINQQLVDGSFDDDHHHDGPPTGAEIIEECDTNKNGLLGHLEAVACAHDHQAPPHIISIIDDNWPEGPNGNRVEMTPIMLEDFIREHLNNDGHNHDDDGSQHEEEKSAGDYIMELCDTNENDLLGQHEAITCATANGAPNEVI